MNGTLQLLAYKIWATREAKCLSIIEHALSLLRRVEELPVTEVELNRQLYFRLLTASRELYPDDEIAPVTECNNQPDPNDEARAKREQKRPDFQWIFLDRYEPDPQRSSREFVVDARALANHRVPIGCSIETTAVMASQDSAIQKWAYASGLLRCPRSA